MSAGVLGASATALGAARLLWEDVHAQELPPPAGSVAAATSADPGAAIPAAPNALRIPPLLSPPALGGLRVFNLALQQGEFQFVPGRPAATLGINGSYLGPTLRAKQDDAVVINVANRIGEATTLHWHGMHLPPVMDGGPHQVIADNTIWSPRFVIRQEAATLWYHPHLMGATQRHVSRGLVGLFLLDDDNPAQALLPHTYGVDDIPLIFQEQVVGADGQPNRFFGRGATSTVVNGSLAPSFTTAQARLRFRLLNASSDRFYTLGLSGDQTFYQVASDGGLLPAPVALTRLTLGPAERAEIVVDVAGAQPVLLQNVQPFRGANGGQPATLLAIEPVASGENGADPPPLPAALNAFDRLPPEAATITRDIVLGRSEGRFTIDGRAMATMADMHDMGGTIRVRLGDTELWNVVNTTRNTHLFHVHDVQFQVIDRSSAPLAANEAGRKDTVTVRPGETVRIIMRFADFADPETPYMFHCHILEHEDQGMMGQFVVIPA